MSETYGQDASGVWWHVTSQTQSCGHVTNAATATRWTRTASGAPGSPARETRVFNALGQLARSEKPGFGGGPRQTSYHYDALGQLIAEDTPGENGPFIETAVSSSASPLLDVTVADAAHGHTLLRETRHAATGAVLSWEASEYDAARRLLSVQHSDGTAMTNTYGCCALASTRARDGTVTEYWRDPSLPNWSATAVKSPTSQVYNVTEVYVDALGRASNTVESVWSNGMVLASSPILATTTVYPYGTSDYYIQTDPYGTQRVVQVSYTEQAETTMVTSPRETTILTRSYGGDTTVHNSWPDGWLTSMHTVSYTTNGHRISIFSSISSDNPSSVVTNGYTEYDNLGNIIADNIDFTDTPDNALFTIPQVDTFLSAQSAEPTNPLMRPPYSTATTNYTLAVHHYETHHPHCQSEGRMDMNNYVTHFNKVLNSGGNGIHSEHVRTYVGNCVYFVTDSNNPGRLYGMDITLDMYIRRTGVRNFAWRIEVSAKNIVTCGCCNEKDECKTFKKLPDKKTVNNTAENL